MRSSSQQESGSYYQVEVNQRGLHIQVFSPSQTYTGLIQSLEMIENLQSFGSLENLKKYLEDKENIQIFLEKRSLEILKKVRSRFIIMAQIPLKKNIYLKKRPSQGPNSIFTVMQELNSSNKLFKQLIKSQEMSCLYLRLKLKNTEAQLQKIKYQMSCIQGYKKAQQWTDPESYCYQNFKFAGNRIICKSQGSLFGKVNLRDQKSFTVQIKSLKYKMRIGLADRSYIEKEYLLNIKNKICIANKKQLYDPLYDTVELEEGKEFKAGDQVIVNIDFTLGRVQWRAGSQIITQIICQKLKDQSITWVPFISLSSQGEVVII